ncbi:uncharacterized protein A1O5_11589 [Cladophialophora psammophila CBS 110553]|uniref:ER-bound oxygenase mpaB/mpaB'/Rubber oxygenase catalytic domain-containing protein n=1 Tax=Cladophialophora psammophila CBS 110553 TaxID=1182543 RepID=W9W5L8_9EURO|nr:uncharacterized protein A1O5_11589 [Cladophialophora psammophila CBS 110553]EXJ63268.1 hypothetical protein A1O5_11589 [Cladophialophora psammophila CBS 110553]
MINTQGYHWINREIQKLDPETEYETIWRLMASYHLSDFMNNLVYTLTFPNFIVTTWGSEAVWREDGGKVVHKATMRVEETENNNMIWWFYGPSDARTKKSVDDINRRHEFWASKYPGHFRYNDDYIYTLAFSAVLMHRLRRRLGLSGFSHHEKVAAHHFWRDMSRLFHAERGVPLHGFPEDWDGCVKFCEDFERKVKPFPEKGRMIALAIYNHFAYRYFPPLLRTVGVSIPIALSLETTLDTLQIAPVSAIWKSLITFVVGWMLWLAEVLLPDPKVPYFSTLENQDVTGRRARRDMLNTVDKGFVPTFVHHYGNAFPGGCPVMGSGMTERAELPKGMEKFT